MVFKRKISPLECSYLAYDQGASSAMVNQYVLEGIGSISLIELRSAVAQAAEANPGVTLSLVGKSFWRGWKDKGQFPAVRSGHSHWAGQSSDGASFHLGELDCQSKYAAEVIYLEGETPRIIFRTHHALMDGNATLYWIQEVCRALRGEPLQGSDCTLNEWELAKKYESRAVQKPLVGPWNSVFPKLGRELLKGELGSSIWAAVRLKKVDDKALPKTIALVAKKVRAIHGEGAKVVVRVPSDLRRLLPADQPYQLSNVVSALDLEIGANDDANKIYRKILSGLQKKYDLNLFHKSQVLARALPKSTFIPKGNLMEKNHRLGETFISAVVTHVGRVSLADLSCEGFRATDLYAVPVPLESVSLSCVFVAHDQGLSLCMSAPQALASIEDLEGFARDLAAEFGA